MANKLLVIPEASPLLTLATADRLDLLRGLSVAVFDTVLLELGRLDTPESRAVMRFIENNCVGVIKTEAPTGKHAMERALQDFLLDFSNGTAVLLLDDEMIKRTTFVLPDGASLLSTKDFLELT